MQVLHLFSLHGGHLVGVAQAQGVGLVLVDVGGHFGVVAVLLLLLGAGWGRRSEWGRGEGCPRRDEVAGVGCDRWLFGRLIGVSEMLCVVLDVSEGDHCVYDGLRRLCWRGASTGAGCDAW